jgi:hypothetical protein
MFQMLRGWIIITISSFNHVNVFQCYDVYVFVRTTIGSQSICLVISLKYLARILSETLKNAHKKNKKNLLN